MPIFKRCDKSVEKLADEILKKYETHKPLVAAKIKLDLVFAFADTNEKGQPINNALNKNGIKALSITRSIPLKDRALGRGDAEIAIDGDWWAWAGGEEQAALLDHELHHISIKMDRAVNMQYDDLRRPIVKLRKHDVEVGWFRIIAARHGSASQEQIQAKKVMDSLGQWFWPGIAPTMTLSVDGKSTGPMPMDTFSKAAALIEKGVRA